MNNATEKTLLEAKNAALRAELDIAENTIKSLTFDKKKLIEKDRLIENFRSEKIELEKNNKQLKTEQISEVDKLKVNQYDTLCSEIEEYEEKNTKLAMEFANESDKRKLFQSAVKSLELQTITLKSKSKNRLIALCAMIIITFVTATGGYFYVQSSLAPPENLSEEAKEQYKKFTPEFNEIIKNQAAYDRKVNQEKTEELNKLIAENNEGGESWFSYVIKILSISLVVIFTVGGLALLGFLIKVTR